MSYPDTSAAAAYWRRRPGNLTSKDDSPLPRPNTISGHRERFESLCPMGVLVLELLNDYEVPHKKYMTLESTEEAEPCWVPKHALIDLVTLEGPELQRWREKFGDRAPQLPAGLMQPTWWRPEFGDRWEWAPGLWSPLSQDEFDFGVIADWVLPAVYRAHVWNKEQEISKENFKFSDLWKKQFGVRWQRSEVLFSFWGPQRCPEPVKLRRPSYEVISRSLRATGNEVKKGVLDPGAVADRAMSFGLLSSFASPETLKSLFIHKSDAYIRGELDRLNSALSVLVPEAVHLDPSIYETGQMIAVGTFHTASTSSALAHSTRWLGDPTSDPAITEYEAWKRKTKPAHWNWKDLINRRKSLWGSNDIKVADDFHERMTLAVAAAEPISDNPPPALAARFKTNAADLKSTSDRHIAQVNADERKKKRPIEFSTGTFPTGPAATVDWTVKPTKALMDFWNALLADEAERLEQDLAERMGKGLAERGEKTGFENIGNEELRSLKYKKSRAIPKYKNELVADLDKENQDEDAEELPDEHAEEVPDEDAVESDVEEIEPEDDDTDADNEETEFFAGPEPETSEGTCYSHDPRFSDDDEEVGPPEGHDHIIPTYEDNTRKVQDPYTHEELEAARKHAGSEKWKDRAPVIVSMVFNNRTPEEALEIWGVEAKPKTAQKWKERFMEEADLLKYRPNGVPDAEVTDEMLDDIKAGGAYVLLDLGNGWKYHCLDTETYASLDAAVQALKEDKIRAAWKESDLRKETQKGFIKNKEARRAELQKIRDKFNERFKKRWVLRDPNQWPKSTNYCGLLGDLVGLETEN